MLVCVLTTAVSGALAPQALGSASDYLKRAQRREEAGEASAAQRDRVRASHSYIRAAKHYQSQALIQADRRDYRGAALLWAKTAVCIAAAEEQSWMHWKDVLAAFTAADEHGLVSIVALTVDYAREGHYRRRYVMHARMAECYGHAAEISKGDRDQEQTELMHRAAAEQFEAGARCALVLSDNEGALLAYHSAAEKYRAVGDLGKEKSMRKAVARLRIGLQVLR